MSEQPVGRDRRRVSLLVLMWVLAVPTASVLGVLALRAADGGSSASVLSAGEAASLASASPSATAPAADGSTSTPAPIPDVDAVTERRVPGAVLGLRCAQTAPVLVWSVPDVGWQVDRAEVEDDGLRVRLEADDEEVQVIVVCRDGEPEVVGATRDDD